MDTSLRNISVDRLRESFKSGVSFLYTKLIEPRANNEDDRRREFILNTILSGSILLLVALDYSVLLQSITLGQEYHGIPFPVFTSIVIFFCTLHFLSRKGYFHSASYLMIGFYYLGSTYGAYHWGVELQYSILSYILVIIVSSILISTRFGFVVTGIIAVSTITIGQLELQGIIDPLGYWKLEQMDRQPFQFAFMYFLIMTVSWLSNREIEKSLRRARISEAELIKERDLLEIKVEERTRALHLAQAEKVSQLYRFAEFGRLSSGIFHDLVNPLSVVASSINSLEGTLHPDIPHIKDSLNRAIQANKHMEKFIIAVKKQIRQDEVYEQFEMSDQVHEILTLLHFKALKARVDIEFKAFKKITTYGNPFKFQQIIMNLISNAIDACEAAEGGLERRRISVRLNKNGNRAKLTVADKGCGIPKSVIERVFDPFFTTKSNYKGMGLGLSTTKTLVEKNFGGTISVHSVEGEGSVFSVVFPLHATQNSVA